MKSIWRVYSQVAVIGLRSAVLICLLAPPFHSLRCTHLINPRGLFPSFDSIVYLLRRAPSRAQWHLFARSIRPWVCCSSKTGPSANSHALSIALLSGMLALYCWLGSYAPLQLFVGSLAHLLAPEVCLCNECDSFMQFQPVVCCGNSSRWAELCTSRHQR